MNRIPLFLAVLSCAAPVSAGTISAVSNRGGASFAGPALAVPALSAASVSTAKGDDFALPPSGLGAAAAPAVFDFDAAVVGSGYGGSVTALRLAEAGHRVAVLERGKRFAMGQFPRGEDAYFEPEKGRTGNHEFREMGNHKGWIGAGVGGGSLVNASIMLRKTDFTGFPAGIDALSLARFYDRVEDMLDAKPYPVDDPASPHFGTPKTEFMRDAARRLGKLPVLPNVAVNFAKPGEPVGTVRLNKFGAPQQGCRGCGECSLPGCNYGAKNTLDLNYLRRAEREFGAKILPSAQAGRIEPLP